jgi:hypothetical protein
VALVALDRMPSDPAASRSDTVAATATISGLELLSRLLKPDEMRPESKADCPEANRLRGLLDCDDLIEYQQTIIRKQRSEIDSKAGFLSHVTNVLAKPNDEMSSTEKVVTLALAYEVHYRANRGRTKLPLIALVERTGLSKKPSATYPVP